MGPPLISGGNDLQGGQDMQQIISFNGAAADQRRKRGKGRSVFAWDMAASMGPPLISGGNLPLAV